MDGSRVRIAVSAVSGEPGRYDATFLHDYRRAVPHLRALGLPLMPSPIYERMRCLFRVKHGFTRRGESWICGGAHGLFIYGFTKALRPRSVLDIGTCWGFSALCAALGAWEQGLSTLVVTIDRRRHEDYGRDPFFDELRRQYVIEFTGRSADVLPARVDHPVDLAFVDGGHSYEDALFDLLFVGERLTDRGILIVDDCALPYVGVMDAVRDAGAALNLRVTRRLRLAVLSRKRPD